MLAESGSPENDSTVSGLAAASVTHAAIEIDWVSLSHAFESGSAGTHFFLDGLTGKVIAVTEEALRYAETSPYVPMPEWMQNAVWQAGQVREECGKRYHTIPMADTTDEYRDMESFIPTVDNSKLQGELWRVIRGAGAFRRFRDVLAAHPDERTRWLAYKDNRVQTRINEWLANIGLTPANPRLPAPVPGGNGDEPSNPDAERQELIEELTLLLLYLSSWQEPPSSENDTTPGAHKAWKGFTYATLNALEDHGLIHQSRKARSVTLTEEGLALARELEMRFRP
jgi:hypothetical protein